ncbi:MAG: MATE family efflux transporter [Ruminococcaceae bacterium]|nr:MATE family efflux transporter [Oscillospiraceae bacterium]
MKNRYEIDMCSGTILPKLLRFAFPLMLSSILQLLFNAADVVVVGRFAGDTALAAVGSNTNLISLLTNLFMGCSVGSNILAARFYGAQEHERLHRTVHTSMLLSVIGGLVLSVIGCLGAKTILVWMNCPDNILDLAALYLRIYFLGMPATMLYNFGAALLRAAGDTQRPMYYLTLAGVVNVLLNLYFVIVLEMSVAGVATATVISQYISAALVVRCMTRNSGAIHLDLKALRFHKGYLKQILQVGLPAGLQGVLFSVSNVLIQSSVNTFGDVVMAGNAAAVNIEHFIYVSMNAFYQANMTFVSQNYGAGRFERIRPIILRALGCVMVVGVGLGNLTVLFGRPLLGIYSTSADVIAAGMNRLSIVCAFYALCGMMDCMMGALRGLGYITLPMLVSLFGACGLRLLWLATIFQIPSLHSIRTLYWSYPISWLITFAAQTCFCIWAMKRLKRHLETGTPLHTF